MQIHQQQSNNSYIFQLARFGLVNVKIDISFSTFYNVR